MTHEEPGGDAGLLARSGSAAEGPTGARRLWLVRHAKSSWDDPGIPDHDRPLSRRGERDADRMGTYLTHEDVRPALVLCSSALRARQTLARLLPSLGDDLEVGIEPSLYVFEPAALLDRLRSVRDDLPSVLLIGHNPAMQELAVALDAEGASRSGITIKFPTGALAALDLRIDTWTECGPAVGALTGFVPPRSLA